jgi:inorganic pyrophosphatase
VLAGPTGDPYSEGLSDPGDVPKHSLKELAHFFPVYKDLEGTRTETKGFEGAGAAKAEVERAMELYRAKFGGS